MNIINENNPEFLMKFFLYFVNTGINPYFIFIFFIIIIFLLYILLFYRGNLYLLKKDFKKMSPTNKRNWLIFLFVGIFMAFTAFYQTLDLVYSPSDVTQYHVVWIDDTVASFGDRMVSFLEKKGILK